MNNKSIRTITLLILGSLPLMMFFQNCGKGYAVSNIGPGSNLSMSLDSSSLPTGNTAVDQTNPGTVDPIVSIGNTVVSGDLENQQDIDTAKADCAALSNSSESNNSSGVVENLSVTGLRGKNVLSKADFNGKTQIDFIDNSFGKLTLCGLEVKTVANSGGKLILMDNSKITNLDSFFGNVVLIGGSSVIVNNSNVQIFKNQ